MTYHPEQQPQILKRFSTIYNNLQEALAEQMGGDEARKYLKLCGAE